MADVFAMEDARNRRRESKVIVGIDLAHGTDATAVAVAILHGKDGNYVLDTETTGLGAPVSDTLIRQRMLDRKNRGKHIEDLVRKKPRNHIYEASTNGTEQAIAREVQEGLRGLDVHAIEKLGRGRDLSLDKLAFWYIRKNYRAEGRDFPKGHILCIETFDDSVWGRAWTGTVENGKPRLSTLGYLNADSIRPPGTICLIEVKT